MQHKPGGIVELLACDYRDGGAGYVRHDAGRLAMLGANPSLYALFGQPIWPSPLTTLLPVSAIRNRSA